MPGKDNNIPVEGTLKQVAKITPVLLVIMLAGAIIYYKQSMLFSDCAHNIFRIINHNHLEIEASRYGIFISQLFPLMAERLHCALPFVMMSYAGSFYVFYLAVALLLIYRYKNYGFTILLGLYVTLLVSDSYYYLNNEGIAWLLLALAINFSLAKKRTHCSVIYTFFILSIYLALWTHPLVMLAAIYLWFFFMADRAAWPYTKIQSYILTAILLLLSFWKFYQGMHHGYDSAKIETITQFEPKKLLTIYKAPQFHFLIKSCITNYWLFSIISILGLAALIKEKKYLLSMLTIAFEGGYFVLLCITFWDTDSRRFYMEIEYMPLTIIGVTPFVYYVLPKLNRTTGMVLVAVIYFIRLGYMHHAVAPFTNRLAMLERIHTKMKEKNLNKLILTNPTQAANDALIMNWGAPVECMLLSQLEGEKPQRTFIFLTTDEMKVIHTTSNDTLIGCWEMWSPKKINNYYFEIDTGCKYQVMDFGKLME